MLLTVPQSSASIWYHCEHRETYQKLLEDIAVLHRLAARLSSRAEVVGAVRQVSPTALGLAGWYCSTWRNLHHDTNRSKGSVLVRALLP